MRLRALTKSEETKLYNYLGTKREVREVKRMINDLAGTSYNEETGTPCYVLCLESGVIDTYNGGDPYLYFRDYDPVADVIAVVTPHDYRYNGQGIIWDFEIFPNDYD